MKCRMTNDVLKLLELLKCTLSCVFSLLLKAVSGEDTQDRTDRAILTPWVKFLWESYRQCLDLLRNNSKVEKLYQDIAQQGEVALTMSFVVN